MKFLLHKGFIASLILALLFITPFFFSAYITTILFITLMAIVLALSYDIMGGITGYLNLAHCTFFGIGAYAFGILFLQKLPLAICFVLPILIVVAYAAGISFPLFRIKGVYFALATIGLVRLINQLALNLRSLTGGSAGCSIVAGQQLLPAYYMTVGLAFVALFTNYKILGSNFGLALTSIREDEEVAHSFGINSYPYKTIALMISSAIAACMGTIYMFYITYIVPDTVFGLELVFSPAIMAMLGGTGTLFGPVLGAVFITLLQEIIWTRLAYLHLMIYGLIFAMVGLFMPGGILRAPRVRLALSRVESFLKKS